MATRKPPAKRRAAAPSRPAASDPRTSGKRPAKRTPAPAAHEAMPSLAALKRARARLDAALAALERGPKKR